jgi:hypothetical protein
MDASLTSVAIAALGGAGKILQIIEADNTGVFGKYGPTWQDVNQAITITPLKSNSKILVMFLPQYLLTGTAYEGGGRVSQFGLRALRGATVVANQTVGNSDDDVYYYTSLRINHPTQSVITSIEFGGIAPFFVLDEPAVTSALTYKLQASAGGGGVIFNLEGYGTAGKVNAVSKAFAVEVAQYA